MPVPGAVLHTLSSQLGIADPDRLLAYRESEQRWRHTTEIRARYGYRFCPRLADVGGRRYPRVDADADYGDLNTLARQRVNLDRVTPHWDDVLRLVGSLKLGLAPVMGIMRTLQVDARPTSLARSAWS